MNKKASPEQIDAFLRLFDNDPYAAEAAIRERVDTDAGSTHAIEIALPRSSDVKLTSGPVVLSVSELSKEYKVGHQKVSAINGVTFDIHEGEFVALTGSSGSGKSTLLQLVGGLEKPTSGTVAVGGVDLNTMNDHKLSQFRGQTIGFVFQFFYLQPFLRLGRNLEVPGMFAHTNRHERQVRVRQLAEIVGIADRLNHFPKELSGGQIQRAAVVRALLNNPKVILADEPTGNLDSKNSAGIIELFERIRREFGTTIVVATHDPNIAAHADRTLQLKDGRLV